MERKRIKHSLALKPGTMLRNRYRICFCIGQGGFGITYEALDTKLNISVCIKEFYNSDLMCRNSIEKTLTISDKHRDEFFVRKARFIAEAQNLALFSGHRNLPNVYEVFNENNTAYIVMELLNGEELSTYMKELNEPLPIDLALMIGNEICEALKAMHQKKIIHADVAPDNIFICSNEEIRIKLIDLGAAHFEKEKDSIDAIVKPGYSPVEQYQTKNEVDPRSDIYSLGATLYIMLTGMKPQESIERKVNDRLPEPKMLNPLIGDNLNNVIMKAMAVEKHMRFNNVEDFQKALRNEVIVPPLKVEHKIKNMRRNILLVAMTLFTCFCIGGAIADGMGKYYQENLKPASITIRVDEGYKEAVSYLVQQFNNEYEQIEIDVVETTSHTINGVYSTLSEATICLTDYGNIANYKNACKDCLDLKDVQNSSEYQAMLLFDESDAQMVDYGFAVPVIIVVNSSIEKDYVSIEEAEYCINKKMKSISLSENYASFLKEDVNLETLEKLGQNEDGTVRVFLTDSTDLIRIDALLQGKPYQIIYPESEDDAFASLRAICVKGNDAQNNAMEMFLRYLCLDDCQEILMIFKNNDGHIPLAKEAMKSYCMDRKYYKELLKDE